MTITFIRTFTGTLTVTVTVNVTENVAVILTLTGSIKKKHQYNMIYDIIMYK